MKSKSEYIDMLIDTAGTYAAIQDAWGRSKGVSRRAPENMERQIGMAIERYLARDDVQLTLHDVLEMAATEAPTTVAKVTMAEDVQAIKAFRLLSVRHAQVVEVPTSKDVRYLSKDILEEIVDRTANRFRVVIRSAGAEDFLLTNLLLTTLLEAARLPNYCYKCDGNPRHTFSSDKHRDKCIYPNTTEPEVHISPDVTEVSRDECEHE